MTSQIETDATDTRSRLIIAAATLFRDRGFYGTALSDILEKAEASKSSLFHHFPAGKDDLAFAAAQWADAGMLGIVDDAFADAESFDEGAMILCRKLARFMERQPEWAGCPVSQILFRSSGDGRFRQETARIFDGWCARMARHGVRLGLDPADAEERAETLFISLEGGWTLARARQDPDILRSLAARLRA